MLTTKKRPAANYAEIIAHADQDVARLKEEIASREQRVQAAQDELLQLDRQESHRADNLKEAETAVQKAEQRLAMTREHAVLAYGTAHAKSVLEDHQQSEKQFKAATAHLPQARERAAAASAEAEARRATLAALLADESTQLAQAREQLQATTKMRQQAHEAHGEERYQAISAQYTERQAQERAQIALVTKTQLALRQLREEAVTQLADWPDLLRRFAWDYAPGEDGVTRSLEAYLSCLEALMLEAPALLAVQLSGTPGLLTELQLSHDELTDAAMHSRFGKLQAKRAHLLALLEQYRAML